MSVVAHTPSPAIAGRDTKQIHIPEHLHKILRRRAADEGATLFDVSCDVISRGLGVDSVGVANGSAK